MLHPVAGLGEKNAFFSGEPACLSEDAASWAGLSTWEVLEQGEIPAWMRFGTNFSIKIPSLEPFLDQKNLFSDQNSPFLTKKISLF